MKPNARKTSLNRQALRTSHPQERPREPRTQSLIDAHRKHVGLTSPAQPAETRSPAPLQGSILAGKSAEQQSPCVARKPRDLRLNDRSALSSIHPAGVARQWNSNVVASTKSSPKPAMREGRRICRFGVSSNGLWCGKKLHFGPEHRFCPGLGVRGQSTCPLSGEGCLLRSFVTMSDDDLAWFPKLCQITPPSVVMVIGSHSSLPLNSGFLPSSCFMSCLSFARTSYRRAGSNAAITDSMLGSLSSS